jgi:hypothetical protein
MWGGGCGKGGVVSISPFCSYYVFVGSACWGRDYWMMQFWLVARFEECSPAVVSTSPWVHFLPIWNCFPKKLNSLRNVYQLLLLWAREFIVLPMWNCSQKIVQFEECSPDVIMSPLVHCLPMWNCSQKIVLNCYWFEWVFHWYMYFSILDWSSYHGSYPLFIPQAPMNRNLGLTW